MATIGTFTSTGNGFSGAIKTLCAHGGPSGISPIRPLQAVLRRRCVQSSNASCAERPR
ncbi:hypothetical protein ABIF79_011815 [Bradyrhizobium japonicum]